MVASGTAAGSGKPRPLARLRFLSGMTGIADA
jgi:hypothetical protein